LLPEGGHCGVADLLVTDQCNQNINRKVRSPEGEWEELGKYNYNTEWVHEAILADGWVQDVICCIGPWTRCYVVNSIPSDQCYQFYYFGLGYANIYVIGDAAENAEYKVVQTKCESYRNCYNNNGCYRLPCQNLIPPAPKTTYTLDPYSGLSVPIITAEPRECYWVLLERDEYCDGTKPGLSYRNFGSTFENTAYKWVCS